MWARLLTALAKDHPPENQYIEGSEWWSRLIMSHPAEL